ncbi:hypothetical protein BV898_04026 [Hypsibius exemplaris]|uniref:Uncharacterized protein n=1 Tax=Hypsibius exemplaris TaxID=2072580 RepID=A0A1W0X3V3_HYPEX|nr:hypothetical protein BV898_04026 [Hypsibius exemplaris]
MNANKTSKDSLRGKEFLLIRDPTMIPAFEVLRSLEDYLTLSSVIPPDPDKSIAFPDCVDVKAYAEYVDRRVPYIKNDVEAQLPGHLRRLYYQIAEGLRGPACGLSTVDPCFSATMDEILRELARIGLSQAGWYYVVDNLPTDVSQLRGGLLVVMADRMRSPEWKDSATTKLKRIVELAARLRFLMRLSRAGCLERAEVFDSLNIPKGSDTEVEDDQGSSFVLPPGPFAHTIPLSSDPLPPPSVFFRSRSHVESLVRSTSQTSNATTSGAVVQEVSDVSLLTSTIRASPAKVQTVPSQPKSAGKKVAAPAAAAGLLLARSVIVPGEALSEPGSSSSVGNTPERSSEKRGRQAKAADKEASRSASPPAGDSSTLPEPLVKQLESDPDTSSEPSSSKARGRGKPAANKSAAKRRTPKKRGSFLSDDDDDDVEEPSTSENPADVAVVEGDAAEAEVGITETNAIPSMPEPASTPSQPVKKTAVRASVSKKAAAVPVAEPARRSTRAKK